MLETNQRLETMLVSRSVLYTGVESQNSGLSFKKCLQQVKLHCKKSRVVKYTFTQYKRVQKRFSLAQKSLQQNCSLLHPEMTNSDQ